MTDRLKEMERRMVRNYLMTGIGMVVVSPLIFLAVSSIVGIILAVAGIISIIRAATLAGPSKAPPGNPG